MRATLGDGLAILGDGLCTFLGWTVGVFAAIYLALFLILGVWQEGLAGLGLPIVAFLGFVGFAIFFPPLFVASAATLLIWAYFSLIDDDSLARRVWALTGVFLIWLATGVWMRFLASACD